MSWTVEQVYTIPLPDQRGHVEIVGPWPLSAEEWRYLVEVLETMRPGLTTQ